jgi:mono/diheme cytochrome c family protein
VTEVPDHLLQRSKERRAALGGGGDSGGAAPTPAAASGGDAPPGAVPARAAAAAPAVVVEAAPPAPPPPYVQAALDRKKVPAWMAPVGVAAMLWAFIYAGVLFAPAQTLTDPVLISGQQVFGQYCASCHGAQGQGGVGRKLAESVTLTFPNRADHLAWVTNGSADKGTPYGSADRPGGQHIAQSQGYSKMPAFGQTLTAEQILAVVRYEREVLDHADPAADQAASAEGASSGAAGADSSNEQQANTAGGQTDESSSANDSTSSGSDSQGATESNDSPGGSSTTSTTRK